MEFFNEAKAVGLKSHIGKYLAADEDEQAVRQTSNGSSRKARWLVELVDRNPHVIRLKSCYGRYLTASEEPYLLGMTGKKVLQTDLKSDFSIEWEPIKEGYKVKLRTKGGKFLRANGATPPWRNSITHDLPFRTATQDWVMWDVVMVDISVLDGEYLSSPALSFSSVQEDSNSLISESPLSLSRSPKRWPSSAASDPKRCLTANISHKSSHSSERSSEGMEFFNKAKSVRFRSHLGKYLLADDDEKTVRQSRSGSSRSVRWTVEIVDGVNDRIRLKSCHGLYLTAAESPFLLGMTGKKVFQNIPEKNTENSIEWVPVKEGSYLKLMTNDGKFLRANGGTPPWRNSVTHDVPHRTATQNWVVWAVDVVDIALSDSDTCSENFTPSSSFRTSGDSSPCSPENGSPLVLREPNMSFAKPAVGLAEEGTRKSEGRLICYHVSDDDGNFNDAVEGSYFQFIGHGLQELTKKLEKETGRENIIVCSHNRVNGKLYPLRLALPPTNAIINVVVVPSSSKVARDF